MIQKRQTEQRIQQFFGGNKACYGQAIQNQNGKVQTNAACGVPPVGKCERFDDEIEDAAEDRNAGGKKGSFSPQDQSNGKPGCCGTGDTDVYPPVKSGEVFRNIVHQSGHQ